MNSVLHETQSLRFWRGVAAELLATMFYVFCGCGATLKRRDSPVSPSVEHVSLAFGLAMAIMVQCVGLISGGHVNPAVTAALAVTGKISGIRALFYTGAQVSGGIAGAALLYGLIPELDRGSLGTIKLNERVTVAQGVGIELVLTFVLVWVVFSSLDPARRHTGFGVPLAIGLAYTVCHLIGVQFTGCGINPARAFGPAVVMNQYKDHWVYWVGPLLGGVCAGLVYEVIFSATESVYHVSNPGTDRRLFSSNCCQVNYGDEDAASWYAQGLGSYDDLRSRPNTNSCANSQFANEAFQMQTMSSLSNNNQEVEKSGENGQHRL